MPDLTPYNVLIGAAIAGCSAIVGGVIGGCFTIVGVRLTMGHQYRLEVLRDRQALRNATRDRLRDAYTTVFLAAAKMDAIAQRTLGLWNGKEKAQALNEDLRALNTELSRAGIHVLLEQHATEVEATYNEVRQAFVNFQNQYVVLQQNLTDDRMEQLDEVRRQRDALSALVEDLRKVMLHSLAPLNEPIPGADQARRHWWAWWQLTPDEGSDRALLEKRQ
jgi:hypothetical protein